MKKFDRIRKYIEQNNLDEAISGLKNLTRDKPDLQGFSNQIWLKSSAWDQYKSETRGDRISREDARITLNQIKHALFELVNELERNTPEDDNEPLIPALEGKKTNSSHTILRREILYIALILIVIALFWRYCSGSERPLTAFSTPIDTVASDVPDTSKVETESKNKPEVGTLEPQAPRPVEERDNFSRIQPSKPLDPSSVTKVEPENKRPDAYQQEEKKPQPSTDNTPLVLTLFDEKIINRKNNFLVVSENCTDQSDIDIEISSANDCRVTLSNIQEKIKKGEKIKICLKSKEVLDEFDNAHEFAKLLKKHAVVVSFK